jgi:beta-lactamase regulating signal transducer with metallopeptidase domain
MSWLLVVALKNTILVLPLAALALLTSRYFRRPALAHLLWVLVLVKLLTPPILDVPVGWQLDAEGWLGHQVEPAAGEDQPGVNQSGAARPGVAAVPARTRTATTAASRDSSQRPRTAASGSRAPQAAGEYAAVGDEDEAFSMSWTQLIGLAWLLGSLAVLAIGLRRAWQFHRFLNFAAKRDESLGVRAAELAQEAGVGISPRVLVVDGIVSPMLWGFGRDARLVFPAPLAKRLSPAKLDTLILHELAHFARKDHWLRVLELAVCVVYWWHPLVWWSRREIEAAEEECCDAWVVGRETGTRHSYAEALLTTVDFLSERHPALPPAACGLGEVAELRARLTQIMCGETTAQLSRSIQTLVLSAGLLLAPLEPALWATSSASVESLGQATNANRASLVPARTGRTRGDGGAIADAVEPRPSVSSAMYSTPGSLVSADEPYRRPWAVSWGTAVSPNGKYRIEWGRSGIEEKTTLFRPSPLDLIYPKVTCVSFSPDSTMLVTGNDDAQVRLYGSASGGHIRTFKGSGEAITSVHISPDGKRVAAGSSDGSVLVWDLADASVVRHSLQHQDVPVSCVRWSSRGDRLAIALGAYNAAAPELLIWIPADDTREPQRHPLQKPLGALAWLADDANLALAAWGEDKISSMASCQVWNLKTGEPTGQVITIEKDQVSAARFSADCQLISKSIADEVMTKAP